ncbi:MAG TPA: DUF4128 domain-containing protein [Mesorhizobium sp.]|jgi:hypothetical protein|nr:DUF4128 domain-containing protein [Mesorhizobium sp.]
MPLTAEAAIPDALFRHLDTLTLSPALPIAWPGKPFTPPAGAYLELTFLPNTNRNLFLGNSDPTQHVGLLQVTVVGAPKEQVVALNDIAGRIVAHFAKGTTVEKDGVRVRITAKPSVAPPLLDDGRKRVPVSIPYQAFA